MKNVSKLIQMVLTIKILLNSILMAAVLAIGIGAITRPITASASGGSSGGGGGGQWKYQDGGHPQGE